jgi:hypothetical protein
LECRALEVNQNEEQAIVRRRERTVLVHRAPAGGPRCPIEAPRGEMHLERRLTGRDEALKLVERHAGAIEELGRACTSVNWTLTIRGAAFHGRHSIP